MFFKKNYCFVKRKMLYICHETVRAFFYIPFLWGLFSASVRIGFEIALGVAADGANGGGGFAVVGVAAFHAFPGCFGIIGKNSAVFHVGAKAQKAFFVLFFNGGNGGEFGR